MGINLKNIASWNGQTPMFVSRQILSRTRNVMEHCIVRLYKSNKKHDPWTTISIYFETDKDENERKLDLIGQFQRAQ